jgi:hypothetical protein
MKHEPRTLTDEELRYRIKNGGDIIIDVCTELLARRQADRWIPVEERLPKDYENVLASNHNYSTEDIGYRVDGKWYSLVFIPTHWRPLPEPPVQP